MTLMIVQHPAGFQFTPLREGRQDALIIAAPEFDFNSRPSARGDRLRGQKARGNYISIHAPPRGATPCLLSGGSQLIFQFTPLREGRPAPLFCVLLDSSHFNSRPSARGDISKTETPTLSELDFNSRPSARGDSSPGIGSDNLIAFQFTPLREGRREVVLPHHFCGNFNSRPSARGD